MSEFYLICLSDVSIKLRSISSLSVPRRRLSHVEEECEPVVEEKEDKPHPGGERALLWRRRRTNHVKEEVQLGYKEEDTPLPLRRRASSVFEVGEYCYGRGGGPTGCGILVSVLLHCLM